MISRPFGTRSGLSIPPINIGAMRFPQDTDEAVALIRHAIDSGMTYIDTSRGYGDSEIKLGKALKDGYREKVILSTKWSPWVVKIEETDDASADCMRKRIEESMTRLDVEYLDFFQVWSIWSREHFEQATAKGGMVDGIRKAMDEGLVRHTGLTTHDSVDNMLSYMDQIDWCEIILFTYNMLNVTYAPVIEAAHQRGIGTVIMNPVAGGLLAQESAVMHELAGQVGCATVPEMAIRWLLSNPNIDGIISGISKTADVDDSVAAGTRGAFSAEEMAFLETRMGELRQSVASFCTNCRYCLPCPQEINIPNIMSLIAEDRILGYQANARYRYARLKSKSAGADACVQCGACESRCTQHLGIMEEMGYAANTYGELKV